jgi:hypothetical protein
MNRSPTRDPAAVSPNLTDAAGGGRLTDRVGCRPSKPHGCVHQVVFLKERSLGMLKNDLLFRNPLGFMEDAEEHRTLPDGGFGAVLARAGVGKTALLVQMALNSMLRNRNVLHISLKDPVTKVSLWYDEVFSHIARQYAAQQANELWDSLLPHRFIMTFQVEGFSVPKLEERLTDLTAQDIFRPRMILIDGLPFDRTASDHLQALKMLARTHKCHIWFTMRTHRHEAIGEEGIPVQLADIADLFEVIIQLQPVDKEIRVIVAKGSQTDTSATLFLDPATMLITDSHGSK